MLRYYNLIQQPFFDGFKTCHGIKHQIVELPNGEMYGPKSYDDGEDDDYNYNHNDKQSGH